MYMKNILVPIVLVTIVLPILRVLNIDGALTSYQSFLENGSVLYKRTTHVHMVSGLHKQEPGSNRNKKFHSMWYYEQVVTINVH
jgi:hypothetical protein